MSEALDQFVEKLFPKLKVEMRMGQMGTDVVSFVAKAIILTLIFSVNAALLTGFIFAGWNFLGAFLISLVLYSAGFFAVAINLPKLNMAHVKAEIESDIFIPSRMLLTLLEAGNSLITALEQVSYTRAKSSKYFGKIASEIILGKNIDQAIEDAITYTPSTSFRRVLEPIKKSLKTGTDIQRNLLATLNDLQNEKIIEIEKYEKKLSPIAMIYMIFGTIMPAIGVVGLVLLLSLIGVQVEFFPFLFLLLMGILVVQLVFIRLFKAVRPLVKL